MEDISIDDRPWELVSSHEPRYCLNSIRNLRRMMSIRILTSNSIICLDYNSIELNKYHTRTIDPSGFWIMQHEVLPEEIFQGQSSL